MSIASDTQLVRAAQSGSDRAFEQLAARYSPALRTFLRGVCRDAALADDMAQEALIRAWKNIRALNNASAFKSWLFGIGWRAASVDRRASGRRIQREYEWHAQDEQTRPEGISVEEKMALEGAMEQLTADQRACISLCLAAGWSHGEAAEVLDMPIGTIKSHIKRGKLKLLQALGDDA